MKSKKALKITLLSSMTLLFGLTMAGQTFSWYEKNKKITFTDEIGSTAANYYESGDGSKDSPFIISNARHLYNLAWLQYLGTYNEMKDDGKTLKQQYYFQLKNDIDMTGYVLPPIGTKDNPFYSNFDAKNHTISNLTISNKIDPTHIVNYPSVVDSSTFNNNTANIVGVFGVIGSYNGSDSVTYDSSINEVKNLYLDNLTISTSCTNLLVGIFAGYVNSTIDNCGVHYVKINVAGNTERISDFSAVSEYTLIGAYNKNKYIWDDDPSGSGDLGYGTSTDIRSLYDEMVSLNLVEKSTGVISSGTALPFKPSDDTSLSGGSGSKTITTYGRSLTIDYSKSISVADGATNIGYYSGPEIKTYKDYFKKSKSSDDYEIDYDNITVSSLSEIKTVGTNVKNYLTTQIDDLTRKGDSALVLSGTNYLDGSSLGVKGGYNLIKNAQVGTSDNYTGDLLIPYRCIWVAPVKPGNFEMVIVNKDTQSARLAVWKVQRTTPKDYSSGFVKTYYDNTVVGVEIPAYSGKGAYIPYYYGVTVTQEDIDNGYEFVITKYISGANVYITYIDVGSDGDSSTDTRLSLADFDFVTKESDGSLTKIKDDDGNANANYSKSNITFQIGNVTDESVFSFRRLDQSTNGVFYYESTTGGYLSPQGSGTKKKTSDEDCSK